MDRHGRFADGMIAHGLWLFRWRSYLPLLMIALLLGGFLQFHYWLDSDRSNEIWEFSSLGVALLGLALRIVTVGFVPRGTSGRGTRRLNASELNTTAMYSIVRHPLYLANFVIWLGVLLFFHNPLLLAVGALAYWLYYERIIVAEEAFLERTFGASFAAWAAETPALLPRPPWRWRWRKAGLHFSWRSVLRREYSTFFAIIATFTALQITGDAIVQHRLRVEPAWIAVFCFGAAAYLALRTVKKVTSLLDEPGR